MNLIKCKDTAGVVHIVNEDTRTTYCAKQVVICKTSQPLSCEACVIRPTTTR